MSLVFLLEEEYHEPYFELVDQRKYLVEYFTLSWLVIYVSDKFYSFHSLKEKYLDSEWECFDEWNILIWYDLGNTSLNCFKVILFLETKRHGIKLTGPSWRNYSRISLGFSRLFGFALSSWEYSCKKIRSWHEARLCSEKESWQTHCDMAKAWAVLTTFFIVLPVV